MVLYTFLAAIAVAHSSISLRRRFRDLRALDAAAKQPAKQPAKQAATQAAKQGEPRA